jgi:hypothetical protein
MALVDNQPLTSLFDFGDFGADPFDSCHSFLDQDACSGLQFYDGSEPSSLVKELETFGESLNQETLWEDNDSLCGEFAETREFPSDDGHERVDTREFGDLGDFQSGDHAESLVEFAQVYDQYQEPQPVPQYEPPKYQPLTESLEEMLTRIVKSSMTQSIPPQREKTPQKSSQTGVTKKRKPEVSDFKTPRKAGRKAVMMPPQNSMCTRFWSSVPIEGSITIFPTIVPAQAFEKVTKSGELRNSECGLRFKIMRAVGHHYPNKWMLRSMLKPFMLDWHKARGTLINKASTAKSMPPWPPLEMNSNRLCNHDLVVAVFGNDWYFMVWDQSRQRLAQCPMVCLGQKCFDVQNCPSRC